MSRVDIDNAASEAVALAARRAALTEAGLKVMGEALQTVHVISGNLRRQHRLEGPNPQATEIRVENRADYALFEHEPGRTRRHPGHPWLREAIDRSSVG